MSKKKKSKPAAQKKQVAREKTTRQELPEERKKKKKSPPQMMAQPNWVLTGLAAAGMILTAYLSVSGWLGEAALLCSDGSLCDVVQQSRWGTFLGLPTAFWGFLMYSTLFYIGVKVRKPGTHWKSAWTISMIGLGYSMYLMIISLLVIQAACLYCIASFTIMTIIFGVVTFQRSQKLSKLHFAAFARQTVIITAIMVGGMHLHYSGVFDPMAGPEDQYLKGLAAHLTREQAVFYGADW
ncbi:MAG: vitamin K epoxide reductase family protein [Deltaproteobacteria bacterium]|nr:vitamin K epoxide reductase family protein [Deltaproteobacteria bacterium]MBT4641956.1 vitamin K epoxide reductase family protein [Deltaproteobacteria bacterium]MBT6502986.1 vitamin K epoxide reductase family protein [Deltaproteobacteria bacterium]MBT6614649.1 vitamin K epoxide reductase family protein [Deltaproteobacteria bacterium]MBT7155400.1 vitamin K epoxide reductase family protein [Deltaproteobacteria bacterium]